MKPIFYLHDIYCNLICTNCNTSKPEHNETVWYDKPLLDLTKEEIVVRLGNFSRLACGTCRKKKSWEIKEVVALSRQDRLKLNRRQLQG